MNVRAKERAGTRHTHAGRNSSRDAADHENMAANDEFCMGSVLEQESVKTAS